MIYLKEIIAALISYLIGCICTGYYIVYFTSKKDIRKEGSSNVGARNAGRVLGKKGFIFTLIGDMSKGILVMLFAYHLT